MLALLQFAPFSGSTTWHMPMFGWFTRDLRSHEERMIAVLDEMRIAPLESESARHYMQTVIDDESSTEQGTARHVRSRWDRLTTTALPSGVPHIPHRLMRLVDDAINRGAQLGVKVKPLVYVADADPLVGITFKSNGRTCEILLGGYALDQRHRHLLKGGILLP